MRYRLRLVSLGTAVLLIGGILVPSGQIAFRIAAGFWPMQGWILIWAMWSWVVLFPVWIFVVPRMVARGFATMLRAAEYRICMQCGQLLRGLPDRHLCPECGSQYDYDRLAENWKAWLRMVNL